MKDSLKNFFYFLIVLFTGAVAILGIALGIGGIIFLTVPFGLTCGLILGTKFLGPWFGGALVGEMYSTKSARPPPPEFPLIRAKIANEQYKEAAADLEELLKKDPGNYHVIQLLVDIFVEKTNDHENAIGLINAYLKKEDRISEDVPIVMKLVDVYLEIDAADKAKIMLLDELRKKYHKEDLLRIQSRLNGI